MHGNRHPKKSLNEDFPLSENRKLYYMYNFADCALEPLSRLALRVAAWYIYHSLLRCLGEHNHAPPKGF